MSALERFNRTVAPLLDRARRGEAEAFAAIVTSCRPLIYRWSAVATGDLDEAEDLTQEVLVRLHRSLAGFRTDSRFTTWLYGITRNAVRDRLRSRRRRLRLIESIPPGDGAEQPADRVAAAETGDLVRRFLVELPARQREVFDLIDLQELSAGEVAELLDMEPSTVRVHLHRARRTLRSRLLSHDPELAGGGSR
ncbi:MAG: RNA polymerase sigma factor [Gemmatimonadales bacterium]